MTATLDHPQRRCRVYRRLAVAVLLTGASLVAATPEEKARSGRIAMLTSRFNTMVSIGMLYCMVFARSGGF